MSMIKWNALSFLGASNLIGNPVSFINTVGTCVKDSYYEPVNSFMKGEKEGVLVSQKERAASLKIRTWLALTVLGR